MRTAPLASLLLASVAWAAPSIEMVPAGASFVGSTVVTLTSDDPTAEILYTTAFSPEGADVLVYTGPLTISDSTLIRAVARKAGRRSDPIAHTFLALDPSMDGASVDLPQVVLWSNRWAPTTKSSIYTRFTLTTFEPPAGGRLTLPAPATLSVRAGMHIRGSSSAGYPKHPYRVETWEAVDDEDLDVSLLGMPPDGDWILQAPLNFDRALMRNAVIYELSNRIGQYAVRTRFAELYVAEKGEVVGPDDYEGVYVVMERIERGNDRIDITRLDPDDLTVPDVTGGYIFKEDRTGPGESGFRAGEAGGALYFQNRFVNVYPSEDDIASAQDDFLQGGLDHLGWTVTSPGFIHPGSGLHYSDLIDVNAFIDHHILNTLAKNPDAFRLSGYFHKDRSDRLAAGPIWDFDRTMGCASDSRASNPTWWDPTNETADTTDFFEHGFYGGLFDDPAFKTAYFTRMAELLATELSVANMHALVDGMAAELGEAGPRNFDEWTGYPPRGGSFQAEVDLLKDWLSDRHAWMSGCLLLPNPMACTGT